MRRLATLVLLTALGVLLPTAANAYTPGPYPSPNPDCGVSAQWVNDGRGPSVVITAKVPCPEYISLALWHATSLDGNPISSQRLVKVLWSGPPPVSPQTRSVVIPISDDACFWQADLAYGETPPDLSTPYGYRLIEAWHGGVEDCVTQPTTPTPSSTTTSPSPSPSTTTPAPSETVTTPPAPTTSAVPTPTTPAPTPTVTHTHKPKPKPTHHKPKPKPSHKPTPTPTNTNPGGGSGCIASGCDTPSPTPPAQLPFTGTPTWLPWGIGLGIFLVLVGGTLMFFAGADERRVRIHR